MTPAEQRYYNELVSKIRVGWEKNGYEDALAGLEERLVKGASIHHTDSYMIGYAAGKQVKAMKEAEK